MKGRYPTTLVGKKKVRFIENAYEGVTYYALQDIWSDYDVGDLLTHACGQWCKVTKHIYSSTVVE